MRFGQLIEWHDACAIDRNIGDPGTLHHQVLNQLRKQRVEDWVKKPLDECNAAWLVAKAQFGL